MFKCIFNETRKVHEQLLSGTELTPVQCLIIELLGSRKDKTASQKEIEQFLMVQHSTVSGIIKRMEQKGLVRCIPNESDRRIKDVTLTEKADQFKDAFYQCNLIVQQQLTKGMSESDKQELLRLLTIVLSNFKN
ncbi:MAG: MarR family transcriptional regulator [Oscillospiraceae bacterium]|nr:MarR family transcriptional regulator [Oscillospiraceae bacterium]